MSMLLQRKFISWSRGTLGAASILVMAGLLAGCGGTEEFEPPVRPVRAIQMSVAQTYASRTFPGRAEPTQAVTLSARVGGPLVELPIQLGSRVEEGALIARIDPRDFQTELRGAENALSEAMAVLSAMRAGARPEEIRTLEAQLQSAAADLDEARQQFERTEQLFRDGVLSRAEFERDRARLSQMEAAHERASNSLEIARTGARVEDIQAAESRVASLQSRVDAARAALEDTEIRAPFTGSIAETYVENFQLLRPSQLIATVHDSSRIEVRVAVPEVAIIMAGYVTEIVCRFEAFPGREFPAEILEIGTSALPATQAFPVTVILDNPPGVELLAGMTATVEFRASIPKESGLSGFAVPTSAILGDHQGVAAGVVRKDGSGTVRKKRVGTGGFSGDRIVIFEGLDEGDWVVVAGANFLHEGQRVRLLADDDAGAAARP